MPQLQREDIKLQQVKLMLESGAEISNLEEKTTVAHRANQLATSQAIAQETHTGGGSSEDRREIVQDPGIWKTSSPSQASRLCTSFAT